MKSFTLAAIVALSAGSGVAGSTLAQGTETSPELLLEPLAFRNLGPFRAGSWITDIAVPDGPTREHLYTFYVAARNGGVWKTTNNGTTFEPLLDEYGVSAVGDVTLAPSDSRVVWVGAGDAANARSSYSGAGVFRSVDGGMTFDRVGLEDSHHIARIVVHPEDPATAWVAALGHLFSENSQRGVFKTSDGGESWSHSLDLGPGIGAVDLAIHPEDPNVLWAAAYEKRRWPWGFDAGGPGSGIYKSRDGGQSWRRVTRGLPTGEIGRIGLDVHLADPDILYAVIEDAALRPPTTQEAEADREAGREVRDRPRGSAVYRSDDGGESWRRASAPEDDVGSKAAYSFNQLRVDPQDPDKLYVTSETLISSVDGGRSWRDLKWPAETLFSKIFGDVRALWVDPRDPRRLILGSDGGVFVSYDGGVTADHLYHLPLGETYALAVDSELPYNLYVGLQDHEVWKGPVNSFSGAVTLEDWVIVGHWDGMYSQVSPDGRYHYSTTQFGFHKRLDQHLGTRVEIMPRAGEGEDPYRFTWTTPIQLSPHDSRVLWTGSQKLLRSDDRGDTWEERSPDLSGAYPERCSAVGAVRYCAITTLAESPRTAGEVWVGTDDGRVHVTPDGGEEWLELTDRLSAAGAPRDRWVSRVLPSVHESDRVYVAKSGYRRDDFSPYLFRSDDGGESWSDLGRHLPEGPVNVVAEDAVNPRLLFVGTDHGVFVSLDAGDSWASMARHLPPVPVRDLLVHAVEADLVVGTYGRGVWVGDVWALRQLPETPDGPVLLPIEPKPSQWSERADWGAYQLYGDRHLATSNEPDGLSIWLWLAPERRSAARLSVIASDDTEVAELTIPEAPKGGEAEGARGPLVRVRWNTAEGKIDPGEYRVVLEVDGNRQEQTARVLAVPSFPVH